MNRRYAALVINLSAWLMPIADLGNVDVTEHTLEPGFSVLHALFGGNVPDHRHGMVAATFSSLTGCVFGAHHQSLASFVQRATFLFEHTTVDIVVLAHNWLPTAGGPAGAMRNPTVRTHQLPVSAGSPYSPRPGLFVCCLGG